MVMSTGRLSVGTEEQQSALLGKVIAARRAGIGKTVFCLRPVEMTLQRLEASARVAEAIDERQHPDPADLRILRISGPLPCDCLAPRQVRRE